MPPTCSGYRPACFHGPGATLTALKNEHLDHYSVRTAPGPKYKAVDESVVAEVAKTLTHFSTNKGLVAPGATALFRVYVVLMTANEKGSNTVSVTRPGWDGEGMRCLPAITAVMPQAAV